jgi:hypothetical protein
MSFFARSAQLFPPCHAATHLTPVGLFVWRSLPRLTVQPALAPDRLLCAGWQFTFSIPPLGWPWRHIRAKERPHGR